MRTYTQIALASLLATTLAGQAAAVTPLQTVFTGSNSNVNTVTQTATRATTNGTATTTTPAGSPLAAPSVLISKFDTTTGILVGARVNVSGVVNSVSSRVNATVPAGGSNTGKIATANSSNFVGVVSGTGFSAITGTAVSSQRVCSTATVPCTTSPSQASTGATTTLAGSATVATASLGSYAANDGSSVALARTATGTTSVTTGNRATNATATSQFSFNGGSYAITYDYLLFSQPSFDGNSQVTGLSLDLGRLRLSGSRTVNFTFYNLPDSSVPNGVDHTAGASLISITPASQGGPFSISATPFTNLLAGASTTYQVTFAPTAHGVSTNSYTFLFRDYAPGGIGQQDTQLTLDVTGTTVPEPGSWVLLMAGFGLVGITARRRRQRVVAA
ncbi:MAG: PEPxxWA-CTERM sorting domain-containing protein [Sphingomonadales bacterium]|jgi:hypothetical protein